MRIVLNAIFLCVVISTIGCLKINESTDDESSSLIQSPRSVSLCLNEGEEITFNPNDQVLIDVEDFSLFAKEYCSKPLTLEHKEYTDTTGDGELEEVLTSVNLVDNGCLIKNKIIKKGKVIWQDRFIVDSDYGSYKFGGQSTYQSAFPFSAFYLGLIHAPFMDELNLGDENFDFHKKLILNSLSESKDYDELNRVHQSPLSKYMDQYKGKYLFKMGHAKPDIFIWDLEKEKFVPICLS